MMIGACKQHAHLAIDPPDLKILIDNIVRVQLSRDLVVIGNTSKSG